MEKEAQKGYTYMLDLMREKKEKGSTREGNELYARRTQLDVTFVKPKYTYTSSYEVLLHMSTTRR